MTGRTGYARARPEEWRSAQEAFADAVEPSRAAAGPLLEIVLGSGAAPLEDPPTAPPTGLDDRPNVRETPDMGQ